MSYDALPAALVQALERLPASLRGPAAAAHVQDIVRAFAGIAPEAAASGAHRIAAAAGLYPRSYGAASGTGWFARWRHGLRRLGEVAGLEWIYLFHGDGYLREAALNKIDAGAPGAFFVVAVAQRLNDWVGEVRNAARLCAARMLPRTAPEPLADAALFLLDRAPSWRRWTHDRDGLPASLIRGEVAPLLARSIGARPAGPMPKLLLRALRWPEMDAELPRLYREAVQPAVRAVALATLARGRARWPVGVEKKWVDKSLGRFVEVAVHDERPLAVAFDAAEFVRAGARDPAALVRRTAAQAMIDGGWGDPDSRELLERLAADPSPAVRERAFFALGGLGPAAP